MTRFLALLLGLAILLAPLPAAAANGPPRVVVNNVELQFDVPPVIDNNRTLVPMRAIFEALGAEIYWDPETQTVTAVRGQVALALQIGNPYANINGEAYALEVPAKLINDRTMVPLRFISETLGAEVAWDPTTFTATITDQTRVPGSDSLVGFWADNINTYTMVDVTTGMPKSSGWSGEWLRFGADGTFQHSVSGCGVALCGLVVLHGKYLVEGDKIQLYEVLEDWAPMGSDVARRPAYSNKPRDDRAYTFSFSPSGTLTIVDRVGFTTTLHRNQTD